MIILVANFNIVDRIYIARIPNVGTVALEAVGLCFPLVNDDKLYSIQVLLMKIQRNLDQGIISENFIGGWHSNTECHPFLINY